MKFDDIINKILKESQQQFAIYYDNEVIRVGDILPKGLLFDKHNTFDKFYMNLTWQIADISRHKDQPVKIPTVPGLPEGHNFVKSKDSLWAPVNYVIQNNEGGSIDAKNIINIECFIISLLEPDGSSPSGTKSYPSGSEPHKLVYQANNKNGTRTSWINVIDYGSKQTSVVQDMEIVTEKEMTIASHKDHNELVDLIDL